MNFILPDIGLAKITSDTAVMTHPMVRPVYLRITDDGHFQIEEIKLSPDDDATFYQDRAGHVSLVVSRDTKEGE